MSICRIPYENLKTLFIKSINYDRATYRYYRNSIASIMAMPILDEAKVHAIWFMGIVYNNALNVESATETNGIVTEGLPIKISDLVKDKLNEPSTDFKELLKGIESILTEPVAADEADLSGTTVTDIEAKKAELRKKIESLPDDMIYAAHVTQDEVAKKIYDTQFVFNLGTALQGTVGLSSKESLLNLMNNLLDGNSPHRNQFGVFILAFPKSEFGETSAERKVNLDTIESDMMDNYPEYLGGKIPTKFNFGYFKDGKLVTKNDKLAEGKPEVKKEKLLTTTQKLNKIFTKLTKASDATLNNLFAEFEDIINKDALYDKSAKINAYNKFLEAISKVKNISATSLRALIDQKKAELSETEENVSKLINVRAIPVLGEMQYVRKKDGQIKILIFKNDQYFEYSPVYNGENENELSLYTVEPTDYVTPVYGKDNLEFTNASGSEYRLNPTLAKNGIGFEDVRLYEEGIQSEVPSDNRTGNQKISDNLSLGTVLTNQIKIIADRRRILANRSRINLLNEQGYDITFESSLTPAQFSYLAANPNAGPIVTNLMPRAGIDIIVSSKDETNWDYLMSLDTLGFVYPDGTTRFIDWTDNQDLRLFKEAVRIKKYGEYVQKGPDESPVQAYTYEQPTDEEIENIKNIVAKVKEMKSEISEMMDEDVSLEIPSEIFSKYFSISNVFSYIQSTKEQNAVYKPVQTLDSFKQNLIATNSLIPVRIAQFSAGRVIPSTIREENVIGIIKKDSILGFIFEPSIEEGYRFVGDNNEELSYEQVFEAEGFSKEEVANSLKDPYISKYGYFYLLRTREGKWLAKPMYKNPPISQSPEIANFLSTLSALKDLKPEFSEETISKINELIRTYNNFGWGFPQYKGINTNIDFLKMWQGESVYGIRFRASDSYPLAENFNKKNLSVEFNFDYDALQKNLNVLYRELNLNPKDYSSSVQNRLRFGNILQSKIEENKHLLTPAALTALENIEKEFKNSAALLNNALDSLIEKHNTEVAKNPEARYLENGRDIKFLLFRDLNTLEFKLGSKQKAANPLLNYKVFEHNLNNSVRELVITSAKPSLGTAATIKTTTASTAVKDEQSSPSVPSIKKINIGPKKKLSLVTSLNGLSFVASKDIQKQIDDVKRMLGSSVKIDPTIMPDRVESAFVLGYFEENVIKLNKLLPVSGVVYHEAFHAIFRLALTAEERLKYLEAARAILGSYKTDSLGKYIQVGTEKVYLDEFRKKRDYAGVEDDIIVDYIYEEYLADGFRDYKLKNAEPKNKLIKMLYSLLDGLINLFKSRAYREARNTIDRLYSNIDKGKYADVIGDKYIAPRAYSLSSVPTSVREVGGEISMDYQQVDNYTTDQLVDRVTREMLKRSGDIIKGNQESFDAVYDEVTKELIEYFNVKNFITEDNPNAAEIIATYEPMFRNMRFMMGAAHRSDVSENFILDNLTDDPDLNNYSFINVEGADAFSYQTYNEVKQLVKKSFEGVGVIRETTSEEDQAERDESDENEDDSYFERNEESEVGEKYEDSGILTYKPYEGSAEFQKLIKYIKYTFVDERLGISFDKMVNSREVINQIRKVTYNTPKENIVQAVYNHIQYLKDNIDKFNESGLVSQLGYIPQDMIQTIDDYNTLKGVYDTLEEQAVLNNFLPTRAEGTPFYNMFVNVFYRANKNISSISINTKYESVTKEDREDFDRAPVKNSFYVNSLVENHNSKTVLDKFRTNLNIGLESFKLQSNLGLYAKLKTLVQNYNYIIPTNQETLDYEVNRLYTITSYANLNIPRNVIEFAVAASVKENYKEKATFVDPILAQNQKFLNAGDYFNIQDFVNKYNTVLNSLNKKELTIQTSAINSFVSEYEKIIPFAIKYDPSLISNTILNQDNKPINQSIPYVPSIQILSEVRSKGLRETLIKYYGDAAFFQDNPILAAIINNTTFNPNDKSQLAIENDIARIFFENFDISVAGGMFQEFGKGNRRQSTYKGLGDKGYALSVLGLFANRVSVTGNYGQEIIMFEKPITQLEATSTQFNMTSLYEDYTNKKTREAKVKTKLKKVLKQEFNRIAREWESRNVSKIRFEDYNCRTTDEGDVSSTDLTLRAYNFNRLRGFFERDYEISYVGEDDNSLSNLHSILKNAAIAGQTFEDVLSQTYYDTNNNPSEYTVDQILSEALFEYGENQIAELAEYFKSIDVQLDDIPTGIKLNSEFTSLTKYDKVVEKNDRGEQEEKFYYSVDKTAPLKNAFIEDFGYNFWFNSLTMNQLFDGDLAVTVDSVVNFFKRQKSGVIAGNNYRNINIQESDDNSVFAILRGVVGYLNAENPSIPLTTDPQQGGDRIVKFADGQGFSAIDRRIKKFKKDGILSPELEKLIKRLRYTRLTTDEIIRLNDNGIFLGSDKPAVGHPYFYYKDSEHYINRSDSSIVLDEERVAELYDELDSLELDNQTLGSDALARYKEIITEIHSYFVPKRGREFNHHLLNAIEYFRIDVVFDDTVSKKGTVQPLVLNPSLIENNILEGHGSMRFNGVDADPIIKEGYINLSYNAHGVPNSLVYEQVSTRGISREVTDSIQKKLLLPAQLDPKKFPGVKKILDLQLDIVKSRLQLLERLFNTDDPKTLVTKAIQAGLMKQGAGENLLKFFSTEENKFNLNLPILGKQPMFYFFSLFNNSVFGPKVAGKKFYHVSGLGYKLVVDENDNPISRRELDANPELYQGYPTRYPTVKEVYNEKGELTEYVVEVIIPRELASSPQDVAFFEELYTNFLAARIPTADKRSMLRAKVVDYIDASYGNSIIVPAQVHFWAGSDLDIDSLYAETYAYYRNTLGKLVKYGDYSGYTKLGLSKKNAEFIEYLHYMANDPVFADLVDSEQDRIKSDEEFRTRSLANAVGLFGNQVREFFSDTEDVILTLLSKSNFDELSKGKSVTLSIETTGGKNKKKATGLESLGQLLGAKVVTSDKNLGNILKLMDRLVAVVNVINKHNLPSTPDALEEFTKKQGNPVHSKLHNEILKEKMDLLANPEVYETYIKNSDAEKYINEYRSDKQLTENVSEFVGINKSDPYLFQTVGRVRSINNGTLDSVGANANLIKAATLIASSNVRLSKDFTFNFVHNGTKIETNKPVGDSVQKVGGATDVSVDDAKHQNLAPLKISKVNSGLVNVLYIYGYPSQFARLINSVDLVAATLKEYSLNDDPSYSRSVAFRMGFSVFLNSRALSLVNANLSAFTKFGVLKPSKNKINKFEIDHRKITIEFDDITSPINGRSLSDLNITIKNDKGELITGELGSIVLLSFYNEIFKVGNALAFKISKVTDVNKKLRPSFRTLSAIKGAVDFIEDNEIFENATDIFKQHPYLEKLAKDGVNEMSNRSKQVLLDETNLFKAFTSLFRYDKSVNIEDVTIELKSILSLSSLNAYVQSRIGEINEDDMSAEDVFVKAVHDAVNIDYWQENKIEKDLNILKRKFPKNEFLKSLTLKPALYSGKGKTKVITSLIGSKLSIENQNRIINDFYQLVTDSDESIYKMAVSIAVHGIIKDGGISRNEGFLKIIAPELFKYMSGRLDLIQNKLYELDTKEGMTSAKYLKGLDEVFRDIYLAPKGKGVSAAYTNSILRKLVSTLTKDAIGNSALRLSFYLGDKKYLPGKYSDISLTLLKSIVDTILPNNKDFIYTTETNRGGFTKLVPVNTGLNTSRGLYASKTKFEFWKADNNNELFFDMSGVTDTNRDVVNRLLLPQGIYQTRDGNYSFPLYQINNFNGDQVFLLTELDGKPFTTEFFANLFDSYKSTDEFQFLLRGTTAKYKVIDRQGSDRISPNAFRNDVAEEVKKLVDKTSKISAAGSEIIQALPASVKMVEGTTNLRVDSKAVLNQITGTRHMSGNQVLDIASAGVRYSARNGRAFMEGKSMNEQQLNEFANKLGFSSFEEATKDAAFNEWLNSKTISEYWLVPYKADPINSEQTDSTRFYQEAGRLEKVTPSQIDNLQSTVEYQLLNEQNEELPIKGGQSYLYLNEDDAKRFTYILEKTKAFPKKFKVTRKITKYERDSKNPLKYNAYNEYVDYYYVKSNNNKKSNLYDIVDKETGEVIATKVRVLSLSKDSKSKIAEDYGLEYKPTKVFSANRSIAFALYRQKPSKAKYIAQAKRYLYDAIKFLNPEESALKINLDRIDDLLNSFPDEMWDYINTTYSPEDSTRINASISLQDQIKFSLPKLGLLQELEKITGIKLQNVSFKNYDRTGGLKKVLRVEWGDIVVIDYQSMTKKQLKAAVSYYLKQKEYFKETSAEENVRKYAEHRGIDYNELRELVFGDIEKALDNIAYNETGNSDEMELSKWRESIRNYDWQSVELFHKPYENFQNTARERITEKFKDKKLANGISHLDYFFNSNSFNWLNINFNNISGKYYLSDMETEADVGVESKMMGILNPFEMKIYNKPKAGKTFLKEEEVFNRLAAILHEPFHALHALSYGTKEERELRKAFDALYNTSFGREMMDQVFGSGYNGGKSVSYDTLYKEFTAFATQLMLYPQQWINRTDLRSNDIYEFIKKIETLQDKTYQEVVKTYKKIGTTEKTITEEEEIKLSFLEKLYNYIVKALNEIIPLSKKFVSLIDESRLVEKTVLEDVFGEVEETVTKTLKLPDSVRQSKQEFLTAMDELKSAINTLMDIDSASFSSENIENFFTIRNFNQETSRSNISDNEELEKLKKQFSSFSNVRTKFKGDLKNIQNLSDYLNDNLANFNFYKPFTKDISEQRKKDIIAGKATSYIWEDNFDDYKKTIEKSLEDELKSEADRYNYWFDDGVNFYTFDQESGKYYKYKSNESLTPLEKQYEITKKEYYESLDDYKDDLKQKNIQEQEDVKENVLRLPFLEGRIVRLFDNHFVIVTNHTIKEEGDSFINEIEFIYYDEFDYDKMKELEKQQPKVSTKDEDTDNDPFC